jgi:hypothetical protein
LIPKLKINMELEIRNYQLVDLLKTRIEGMEMEMEGVHYVKRLHTLREDCIHVSRRLEYVSICFGSA